MSAPTPPDPVAWARERRRQATVLAGLLLTFLGVLLVSALLPIGSAALDRALLLGAAGFPCLWIGGILLGLGSPRRLRR